MEKPNIDYINKLSRNNEDIKQKFIAVLKFELPIEIDAYYTSFQLKKWKKTAECIHKLKNKIGILGLENGYQQADEYEKNVRNSNVDLREAFEKTLNLMQCYVNSL